MKLSERISESWYQPLGLFAARRLLLAPLAAIYRIISARIAAKDQLQQRRFVAPVVVIGNISVGGTGKTPVILALVDALKQRGIKAGVVSRGYGGSLSAIGATLLNVQHSAAEVGDEPLLIFREANCPVVIGADRNAAVDLLLASARVDVVLSDDGLQHYKLHRDLEIAVIDGARGLGNGKVLPLGPLREPASRLQETDWVLINGEGSQQFHPHQQQLKLQPRSIRRLFDGVDLPLTYFSPNTQVHAVAGIGNPERFFQTLRELKLEPLPHPFPDHFSYQPTDLQFGDLRPVIMTAKDAVKCAHFSPQAAYVLAVAFTLPPPLIDAIAELAHKHKVENV